MKRLLCMALAFAVVGSASSNPQQEFFVTPLDTVDVIFQGGRIIESSPTGVVTQLWKGTGKIRGTLVDKAASPVRNLELTIWYVKGPPVLGKKGNAVVVANKFVFMGLTVKTNEFGEFSFSELDEGEYYIEQPRPILSGHELRKMDGNSLFVRVEKGESVDLGRVQVE